MSNLEKFDTTLKEFDIEVNKLKAISDAYQKLQHLTVTYEGIVKQIGQSSQTLEKLNEQQKDHLLKIEKKVSEQSSLIENKIEQIRKENKEFYKELEATIKIKLDDNRSEIKQLIENERTRLKEIFEIEFAKNTRELRQVIETESTKQTQQLLGNQNTIKVSLWVIGVITIILSAIVLFKLP